MVTAIFLTPDGTYKTSLGGRKIKYDPHDTKRYVIVGSELHRDRRIGNNKAAAARLGRVPRSEAHAAGEAPKDVGLRAYRDIMVGKFNEYYAAQGNPYDAPDQNTVRMLIKLERHDPAIRKQFTELLKRLGANYYRYDSVSHSFQMYTHRQVYRGSFQLPVAIRSKKGKYTVQHPARGGMTKVYYPGMEAPGIYLPKPPGGKVGKAPRSRVMAI